MKESIRVSLKFAKVNDGDFGIFADNVEKGFFAGAIAEKSPVTPADFATGRLAFTNSVVAAKSGGPADTATQNLCREDLMLDLRSIANYVQGACGTLDVLLKCGLEPISTSRTRTVIPKPTILRIVNGLSGQSRLATDALPGGSGGSGRGRNTRSLRSDGDKLELTQCAYEQPGPGQDVCLPLPHEGRTERFLRLERRGDEPRQPRHVV